MAAVCKDRDDAVEAISQARANVILIDSTKVDRRILTSIVGGLLEGQEEEVKAPPRSRSAPQAQRTVQAPKATQPQRVVQAPVAPAGPSRVGSFLSSIKDAANNATSGLNKQQAMPAAKSVKPVARAQPQPQANSDNFINSVKKKGLMQSLKDTFGIED